MTKKNACLHAWLKLFLDEYYWRERRNKEVSKTQDNTMLQSTKKNILTDCW